MLSYLKKLKNYLTRKYYFDITSKILKDFNYLNIQYFKSISRKDNDNIIIFTNKYMYHIHIYTFGIIITKYNNIHKINNIHYIKIYDIIYNAKCAISDKKFYHNNYNEIYDFIKTEFNKYERYKKLNTFF